MLHNQPYWIISFLNDDVNDDDGDAIVLMNAMNDCHDDRDDHDVISPYLYYSVENVIDYLFLLSPSFDQLYYYFHFVQYQREIDILFVHILLRLEYDYSNKTLYHRSVNHPNSQLLMKLPPPNSSQQIQYSAFLREMFFSK